MSTPFMPPKQRKGRMRGLPGTILVVFVGSSFGQPVNLPSFEIADIHASTPSTNPDTFVSGGLLQSGRYDLRRATLLDLIGVAWSAPPDKIIGGPGWLGFDRFDVSAKAPPSTPAATVDLMLQSLLADRFRLVLHKDVRPLSAFALTMGNGQTKLKRADGSGLSGCQPKSQPGAPSYTAFSCRNITMEAFAGALRRMAGDYVPEPVVDSTGLKGAWDFDIRWNARSRVPQAGADRVTVFDAIEKQLGLKLELRQIPTPVLVIDRVNQKPTANPPGSAQMLPPRSMEFEVAAIRPSPPDARFSFRRYPGRRLEIHAFPMRMLISTAWDVDWDHMDERIVGPKWIDSKRFDVVANASTAPDGGSGTGFITEDLQLMLRALLIDRFAIRAHFEDRPVLTYNLVAVKPKLARADPLNRANCREAGIIANDPRDRNPRLSRLIQCQNITMAQFAEQLQSLDRVEATFNKVVDETGLKGAYDFTLSFTPRSRLRDAAGDADAGRQAPGGVPAVSDPNGAISFMDALKQQLGLRLEPRKRLMPVLVIDHIAEKPAEN